MKEYKVVTIDLTTGECGQKAFDESLTRAFLGGGLGAYVLCQETNPDIEPLSEHSVVCILNGLLTGTGVPGGPKLSFCARSPLTGRSWSSNSSNNHAAWHSF